MRSVRVGQAFPATVHEAESCWYDTSRWPSWVDGLDRVVEVAGDWPAIGASVTWESGPAGRGHVREGVVAHEPLVGQTLEIDDDSIQGRQTVAFTPDGDRIEVSLTLAYELKRRSPVTPLVDVLFIRRAIESSLRNTLTHFGLELAERRERPPHD